MSWWFVMTLETAMESINRHEHCFGMHLMLDLMDNDVACLRDMRCVHDLLAKLPPSIGMKAITRPYVFPYEGEVPMDRGITGFVVIAESHVSVHTFPERDYCFVDVFSCGQFDAELATKIITSAFGSTRWERHSAERGLGFRGK